MSDAITGEGGAYTPCLELPSPFPDDPEGAIVGTSVGFVSKDMLASPMPDDPAGAITGSGVGFVPKPCCPFLIDDFDRPDSIGPFGHEGEVNGSWGVSKSDDRPWYNSQLRGTGSVGITDGKAYMYLNEVGIHVAVVGNSLGDPTAPWLAPHAEVRAWVTFDALPPPRNPLPGFLHKPQIEMSVMNGPNNLVDLRIFDGGIGLLRVGGVQSTYAWDDEFPPSSGVVFTPPMVFFPNKIYVLSMRWMFDDALPTPLFAKLWAIDDPEPSDDEAYEVLDPRMTPNTTMSFTNAFVNDIFDDFHTFRTFTWDNICLTKLD